MTSEAEAALTLMLYLWLGAFILFCMLGLYAYFWLKEATAEIMKFIKLIIALYEFEKERHQRTDD